MPAVALRQPCGRQGSEHGADIDGHVVQRESRIAPRAILAIQLAHQRAGIALEQPGAQHDDAQPQHEGAAAARNGEDHVSQRDQHSAPEHGGLRAQQPVGDPATGHRGNVDRRSVKAVDGRGRAVINAEAAMRHLVDQEQQQQRAHAVVAEALPQLGEEEGGKTGGMTEEIARAAACWPARLLVRQWAWSSARLRGRGSLFFFGFADHDARHDEPKLIQQPHGHGHQRLRNRIRRREYGSDDEDADDHVAARLGQLLHARRCR